MLDVKDILYFFCIYIFTKVRLVRWGGGGGGGGGGTRIIALI